MGFSHLLVLFFCSAYVSKLQAVPLVSVRAFYPLIHQSQLLIVAHIIVHNTADNSTGYGPSHPMTRSNLRRSLHARFTHCALHKHAPTIDRRRLDWSLALGLATGDIGATSSPHHAPAATFTVDTSAFWRPPRLFSSSWSPSWSAFLVSGRHQIGFRCFAD